MPEEESQKKELLSLLSEAPAKASLVEKLAQDLQKSAHLVGELAPAVREYVEQVPATSLTPEEWSHQIKGWRSFNEFAGMVATSVPPSVSFSATSYATTSSSNTVVFVTSGVTQTPQMLSAEAKIKRILHRAPLLEEARASMRRLGLDQRSVGERPALDLLEEAHASLGTGSTPALVTLRESIWAAISQLNRRKPKQEAGSGSDMLTSIGRQCGWSHLDASYFERLAVDWDILVKELSGGKQKSMSGQQVGELFDKALVFANALLSGIDKTRLKPSSVA
jgi:hypothetical protein